ncbi:ubiquitin-like protein UBact [Leptospirillum ferriphilum]|jgi:hypothetical protein|uniref:Prokaryotic ubiquitin-like protein UBact n=3 Tax=Leptospirillum TaxID=179 RepID=UBACT_LEPFM|nr:ubiquitin-like protein UBact [Leptospirillum ferriphilum]J9ZCN8.1 RecName: Full=Prokaryotic ubiquitin-like protein UBact [Leptospirillum ferriphilum ML-04]EDZ40449.1 MAG: Protein of unknown function [Leptospirillum sp. Group II '5-way CG']MCL5259409.1 ubiquitin-like protein UBact [Nitrospirota bacterium]AFS54174.1 hypothetical protein LFML04_1974 [Leptospirillum ferriphilum ML-04]KGA93914.1 hypothetical protein LptCag_0540 [Leptospirillum ferriphilum]
MFNGEEVILFPERKTIPGAPGREIHKDAPAPKRPETKKTGDRLMDRMKKVDPNQSERYRQRTGE